jgi:hypothetical protein
VYHEFTTSNYFENLNKKERREHNIKRFTSKLEKCVFLTKHLKKRDTTHNGIRHKKPYIAGFKVKVEGDGEEVVEDINPLDA